jgi:hypothetical protein
MTSHALANTYFPIKDGTPAFSSKLDPVRNHTFPSPLWQQGFISRDKEADCAEKEFLAVNHFAEFIQKDIAEAKEDRHLYELVTERTPVRPYFDLEWDADELDETETLYTAIGIIAKTLHNHGIIGRGLSIYCASGPSKTMRRKASYHVLCDTVQVFRNSKEHGQFVKQAIMPRVIETWGTPRVFDAVPYGSSQSFRLPYQSKWTSAHKRPFLLVDVAALGFVEANVWTIGIYDPIEQFIDVSLAPVLRITTRCEASPEFEKVTRLSDLLTSTHLQGYTEAMNLIYCLWGIEQSDRMCNLIHETCKRAANYEYRWVQNLIRSWKYSAFTIGSLIKWATDSSDKKTVTQILKQHAVQYHNELFACAMKPANHTVIHQRYIEELSFEHTLILKSHLGTGKTVAITNLIRKNSYKRILIISPRKSYTFSQHGAFQADPTLPPLESYLDHYGSLAFPYLIIQAESLHRLRADHSPYDLVIMDESESILCQMHSVVTHAGNMINNHEILASVVKSARQVIFADAFISDRTFHFAALRGNPCYIENTFQPYERKAIHLAPIHKDKRTANLGGFCERIMGALKENKKIVVLWTSKRRGEWFVQNFLAGTAYSHIFYNSGSDKTVQAGLKDVHEAWRDVQCLMMTTSITVGISYDPKIADVEFHEAFLYGSSASALPRDIAQSLLRVRVLKANRLTYVLDTRANSSVGGFRNVWNQLAWKEEKQTKDHPLVKWTMCPDWARYNHCYNVNEERVSRNEYSTVLQRYLTESGYTLCEEVHIPSEAVASLKLDDKKLEWDNIDDISQDVVEHLVDMMKRGEATSDEIASYKKALFRSQFISATEEELKAWWGRFYETGHEGRFWNVVKERRTTVADMARDEAAKRYGIMTTGSITERQTMERFLGLLGMKHSQESTVLSAERLAELAGPLEAAEKELREGMGLRTTQRKTKEWKVGNTIDLITVMLETWGGSIVESVVNRKKIQNKTVRYYSLDINPNSTIWDNISGSSVNYDENILQL